MPLLGFTMLKAKLLDGSKTQTIRRPRMHPLKVGDKLFIYWKLRTKECEKLGEGVITKIVRKKLWEITNEDAKKDGFENLEDFDNRFHAEMHPFASMQDFFDVVTWRWTRKEWEKVKTVEA